MMRLFLRGSSHMMSVNILTPDRGGMIDMLQSVSAPPPSLYGYCPIALRAAAERPVPADCLHPSTAFCSKKCRQTKAGK